MIIHFLQLLYVARIGGDVSVEMLNDIITLHIFDCDSYSDEIGNGLQDGIQESVEFVFTKNKPRTSLTL